MKPRPPYDWLAGAESAPASHALAYGSLLMIVPVAWAVPGVAPAALLRRNVNQTLLIHPNWPDAEPGDSRHCEESLTIQIQPCATRHWPAASPGRTHSSPSRRWSRPAAPRRYDLQR